MATNKPHRSPGASTHDHLVRLERAMDQCSERIAQLERERDLTIKRIATIQAEVDHLRSLVRGV
jgi:hypothetical protein